MPEILSAVQFDALRHYNTPTVANAIELFDVRPRHVGFLPHRIRCLTPELGVIVGYAVTSKTRALPAAEAAHKAIDADYLRYVAAQPGPKIAVGQDLDDPPGLGAQFGEINTSIHRRLGCVGHITDGCPRDLAEVKALGFALFGQNPCVSHGYVRLVEFGQPVSIAGVTIRPGELLHADLHGVCIVPLEIAHRVAAACAEVDRIEGPLLEICRSDDFTLDEYLARRAAMKPLLHE